MDSVEYVEKLGRDNAYLEIEIDNLYEEISKCILEEKFPSQICIKLGRFDISDPIVIKGFKDAFEEFFKKVNKNVDRSQLKFEFAEEVDKSSDSCGEEDGRLEADQLSFLFIKEIFEKGILQYNKKDDS